MLIAEHCIPIHGLLGFQSQFPSLRLEIISQAASARRKHSATSPDNLNLSELNVVRLFLDASTVTMAFSESHLAVP